MQRIPVGSNHTTETARIGWDRSDWGSQKARIERLITDVYFVWCSADRSAKRNGAGSSSFVARFRPLGFLAILWKSAETGKVATREG